MTVLHWKLPGAGRSARTQNLLVKEVGHGWSCWLVKWAADGVKKLPLSPAALAKARAESSPFILQGRVQAALIRRWSAMHACSAARAFAVSLLDRPSVHEVLRDARFGEFACEVALIFFLLLVRLSVSTLTFSFCVH